MRTSATRGFDIAPHAPRHAWWAWCLLAAGLLCLAAAFFPLVRSWQALATARQTADAAQSARQAQQAALRALQARDGSPESLRRAALWRQITRTAAISWSGLFEALELAADEAQGSVSVIGLVPSRVQADAAELELTALALDAPAMLRYVQMLRQVHPVRRADLLLQQPDEAMGEGVLRFRLAVAWDPRVAWPSTGHVQPLPPLEPPR